MNPDLLEALEAEYMELVEKGDAKAIDYAQAESEEAGSAVLTFVVRMLELTGPGSDYHRIAMRAQEARNRVLRALAEHGAPQWALSERTRSGSRRPRRWSPSGRRRQHDHRTSARPMADLLRPAAHPDPDLRRAVRSRRLRWSQPLKLVAPPGSVRRRLIQGRGLGLPQEVLY